MRCPQCGIKLKCPCVSCRKPQPSVADRERWREAHDYWQKVEQEWTGSGVVVPDQPSLGRSEG